jgi:hypothetical protein
MQQFDHKEAFLMSELAPETKPFYALWIPVQEARRRIENIAFRKRLREDPNSIEWNNPLIWSEGIQSTEDEKKLAAQDTAFAEAYQGYSAKRALLLSHKTLFRTRNAAYKKHKKAFGTLGNRIACSTQRATA